MQDTRKSILDYLKEHGPATVDELAAVLGLTAVTVRHHLDILRGEELVAEPAIRHRSTPGRPQYSYSLTAKASEHFPKNYCDLASKLIEEVKASAEPGLVNVIFEGVAGRLAMTAPPPVPGEPLAHRLDRTVAFLNQYGYVARWESAPQGGYLLHTCNCPYEALAGGNPELCGMDLALVGNLLGQVPQRVSRVVEGAASCAYLVEDNKVERNLTN
jgi:predicted ArsR family transcriptional regulator